MSGLTAADLMKKNYKNLTVTQRKAFEIILAKRLPELVRQCSLEAKKIRIGENNNDENSPGN